MPELDVPEYAIDQAPRLKPLLYPGARPERSVVFSVDRMWELRDRWGDPLNSESNGESSGERLGNCRVAISEADALAMELPATIQPYLNRVLDKQFSVIADGRVPVVAIGSNASPAQMRHKFKDVSGSLLVPAVRARLTGARVGFASFVSPLGYVPATLFPEPGVVSDTVVQFLDATQLRIIDESEGSYYRRVWLSAEEYPIVLETGERLTGAYAYVAQHGFLSEGPDGTGGFVMGCPGEVRPDKVAVSRWMPTQSALLSRLAKEPAFAQVCGSTPEEIVTRKTSPDASNAAIVQTGLVVAENALADLPEERGTDASRYGDLFEVKAPERRGASLVATVGRTEDLIERKGRSVVRLGDAVDQMLDYPHHVEIISERLEAAVGERAPRAVAAVYRGEGDEAPPAGTHVIEIDQMLRFGAGVEVGEQVLVRPVTLERPRGFDRLLGVPNSLTLRVTLADSSTAEREVCLVSALSLQLLGVSSGDYIVLEGSAGPDGEVVSLAVKAFEAPEDVVEERRYMSRGSWDSRFPGAQETLGTSPDVPMLFIDSSTRARLGLGNQQLAVVRARPARIQQFSHELREILVVLAVAFIGIFGLVPDPVVGGVLLCILVLGTFLLVVMKLRRRLSHSMQYIRTFPRRR